MANFIRKYLTQEAYDADTAKEYPNVSKIGNSLVYQTTDPNDEWDVMATINVTGTFPYIYYPVWGSGRITQNGSIIEGAFPATDMLEYIKIDEENIILSDLQYNENNTYPLDLGLHTIKWKVKDFEPGDDFEDVADNFGYWAFLHDYYEDNGGEELDYQYVQAQPSNITVRGNFSKVDGILNQNGDYIETGPIYTYDGTITLPSTLNYFGTVYSGDISIITGNAIIIPYNGVATTGTIQVCGGEIDYETGKCMMCNDVDEWGDCIDWQETPMDESEAIPFVDSIYVPSEYVSAYQSAGWNVTAIPSE